jgi:hypothetical protein
LIASAGSYGCVVEETAPVIAVSWHLMTDDAATGCPVGFDTARVVSQVGNGAPIYDLFDCADGAGVTAPLPPDVNTVWVEITDNTGTNLYAQSLAMLVDLSSGNDGAASFDIHNDAGYFQAAWILNGAGSTASCDQVVGLDGISLLATVDGTSTAFEDIWDCGPGYGVTSPLPEGAYTVAVSALDNAGLSIGSADTLTNRVIQVPNRVTNLGTLTINLD